MIAPHPTNSGVCAVGARQPTGAQSPTAQPRQEALRNRGSAVRGVSETPRLGQGEKPIPSEIRLNSRDAPRAVALRPSQVVSSGVRCFPLSPGWAYR